MLRTQKMKKIQVTRSFKTIESTILYIRGMKKIIFSSLFFCIHWISYPIISTLPLDQIETFQNSKNKSRDKNVSIEERLDFTHKSIAEAEKHKLEDTLYLSQVAYRSYLYSLQKDYKKAVEASYDLLENAQSRNNQKYIALSYYKLGRYLSKDADEIGAFKNYVKAIDTYTSLGDSLSIIKVAKRASFIQANLGDLDGAEFTIVNALDYSLAVKDVSELSWFYDILGRVYRERSLWQEAIRYHRKALQLESSVKSKPSLLNNYALTLIKSENYEEAIIQLDKALAYNERDNDKTFFRLLDNYAFAKAKLKDPEAIYLLEEALKKRQKSNDYPGQYASHIHLAEAYGNLSNEDKSKYHAQEAYNIASTSKNSEAIVKALDYLIPVTRKSNKLFEEHTALSDSLKSAQNKAKFEFAKLRYDVEKAEERESVALQLQTASELRENIAVRKRDWALGGLLGVGLLTLVFILYQKERSKKQRLLDQHNTEKRIAKKLHDELANEIYLVMTQIESDNTTPHVADKLEHIYKLSRDISRETQPIQTDQSFPEELALSLQTYTSDERKLIMRGLETIKWDTINAEKKIEIYRVLQELMTNMRKHSKASLVAVVFKEGNRALEINYSDNGQGVSIASQDRTGGLTNTQSRLKSIGGRITFDSAINEGFRAELSVPI